MSETTHLRGALKFRGGVTLGEATAAIRMLDRALHPLQRSDVDGACLGIRPNKSSNPEYRIDAAFYDDEFNAAVGVIRSISWYLRPSRLVVSWAEGEYTEWFGREAEVRQKQVERKLKQLAKLLCPIPISVSQDGCTTHVPNPGAQEAARRVLVGAGVPLDAIGWVVGTTMDSHVTVNLKRLLEGASNVNQGPEAPVPGVDGQ